MYDANGNMISDANKGITNIKYNHLNLPTEIAFANGGKIEYLYDAAGVKLQKKVIEGNKETVTDYLDGYIYENGELKQYPHAEGHVRIENGVAQYVYYYKDQVNNVRLMYCDLNGDGSITQDEILQERNYYPFGLEHKGYNNVVQGKKNNYRNFQDQEFTEDLGLNIHEWKYRVSDPSLGRFWQVDPLAEEYSYMSTYQFSSNQPIHDNELEGLESNNDLNKRTEQLLDEAKESFSNVLDVGIEAKAKVGLALDVGVQVGPIEGKAEVAALDGKANVDIADQKVKLNGRAGAASGSIAIKTGGVEHSKISGNATALNVSTGVSLDSNNGIKVDKISTEGSLTASSVVESNGASLKLSHKDIKVGGQIGLFRAVKVKGSLNIGELGNGLVKGFAGMASYLSDRVNESINNAMEKINE